MKISVVRFDRDDWNRVYTGILDHAMEAFDEENAHEVATAFRVGQSEALRALIGWFVAKLSGVNQLAFYYQYRDEKSVLEFARPERGETLSAKELDEQLGLVEYNCIDNAGNNFMPNELRQRLMRIREHLQNK